MPEARQIDSAAGSPPLVDLDQVCKTFRSGQVQALRGVTLTIAQGEFVCVMGPSGCGKTTLLNMLGALDRPCSGEVSFDGKPLLDNANLDQIRSQQIGFVFQSFYLLPNLTAVENVQLPMFGDDQGRGQRRDRAAELLDRVGLAQRKRHLPKQLSIGQCQRVAIARALANRPRLILADEPTGALDSQSGREVLELLAGLNAESDTALMIVTHDENVGAAGSRLIRMLDGQVQSDQLNSHSPDDAVMEAH